MSFVFGNENITLKNIWLLILQDLHSLINTTCIIPLLNISIFKTEVNKNIFNLEEWHQNTQNCQSLFQQIFVYRPFTVGIETNSHFIKVFYKTNTCPRQPLLSGPKSGHLIQVWLYYEKVCRMNACSLSIFILFQLQSWIILRVRTTYLLRNFHMNRVIMEIAMMKIVNNCIVGRLNKNHFPLNESSSLY